MDYMNILLGATLLTTLLLCALFLFTAHIFRKMSMGQLADFFITTTLALLLALFIAIGYHAEFTSHCHEHKDGSLHCEID